MMKKIVAIINKKKYKPQRLYPNHTQQGLLVQCDDIDDKDNCKDKRMDDSKSKWCVPMELYHVCSPFINEFNHRRYKLCFDDFDSNHNQEIDNNYSYNNKNLNDIYNLLVLGKNVEGLIVLLKHLVLKFRLHMSWIFLVK